MAVVLGGVSLAAIIDGLNDDDDNDATDLPDDDSKQEVAGTDGDDTLVAEGNDTGDWDFFTGSADEVAGLENSTTGDAYFLGGDDTFDPVDGGAAVDTLPGLTEVDAGAGDDSITVSGYDVLVYDSEGNDTVDASGLESGAIQAGFGDHIIGSDTADAPIWVTGSGYTFEGGRAAEYVFAGDGDISGGGGNDTLIASGTAELIGGDGDDYLRGNYDEDSDNQTATDIWEYHTNAGPNALKGGAGNDRIDFDTEDWVTGGAGADTLTGYVAPSPDEATSITDFNPAEDNLTIWVEDGASDVTLEVENGSTVLMQVHQALAVIHGQSNLTLGYQLDGPDGDVVDANGAPIDAKDVDFIVGNYIPVSS